MAQFLSRPWIKVYDAGIGASLEPYPPECLHVQLEQTSIKHADKVACITSGRVPVAVWLWARLSLSQIKSASTQLAAALAELGVSKGDAVALILPNCVQFIVAFYAIPEACFSGSAPLAPSTKLRFEELLGRLLREGFGMSETPNATHGNPMGRPGKDQSISVPIPDVECSIVNLDDERTHVGVGEVAEMIIRSPNMMLRYLNLPGETAIALRDMRDCWALWLFTGDIARMDAEGFFYIVDRKKDMALIGGFNGYPTTVEKVLASHPAVDEVGVA